MATGLVPVDLRRITSEVEALIGDTRYLVERLSKDRPFDLRFDEFVWDTRERIASSIRHLQTALNDGDVDHLDCDRRTRNCLRDLSYVIKRHYELFLGRNDRWFAHHIEEGDGTKKLGDLEIYKAGSLSLSEHFTVVSLEKIRDSLAADKSYGGESCAAVLTNDGKTATVFGVEKVLTPAVDPPQSCPVVLKDDGKTAIVRGIEKLLRSTQYKTIKALCEAFPLPSKQYQLTRVSHNSNAPRDLKRLAASDPDWAQVLYLPGQNRDGYRIKTASEIE